MTGWDPYRHELRVVSRRQWWRRRRRRWRHILPLILPRLDTKGRFRWV